MQIHFQLATLKKGSETIAMYYQQAKLLNDTLVAYGKTLSSTEFITFLLASLQIEYESMITSKIIRVDSLTSAQVYNHLLIDESRLAH